MPKTDESLDPDEVKNPLRRFRRNENKRVEEDISHVHLEQYLTVCISYMIHKSVAARKFVSRRENKPASSRRRVIVDVDDDKRASFVSAERTRKRY